MGTTDSRRTLVTCCHWVGGVAVVFCLVEAEVGGEEPSMDFDGLELEMESPDEPEDEELKP